MFSKVYDDASTRGKKLTKHGNVLRRHGCPWSTRTRPPKRTYSHQSHYRRVSSYTSYAMFTAVHLQAISSPSRETQRVGHEARYAQRHRQSQMSSSRTPLSSQQVVRLLRRTSPSRLCPRTLSSPTIPSAMSNVRSQSNSR